MSDRIEVEVTTAAAGEIDADVLVLPVFEGRTAGPGVAEVGRVLGADPLELLGRSSFTGKAHETFLLPVPAARPGMLLFVGLGPSSADDVGAVREGAMRAGATTRPFEVVAATLPQVGDDAGATARAFVEGFLLGSYRFDRYRSTPPDERVHTRLVRAVVGKGAGRAARAAVARGSIVARATNWARDLVNSPAGDATPDALAEEALAMAAEVGLESRVRTKAELERDGFGGVLAVGAGGAHEPRMVELSYSAGGRRPSIALTGKGVTFDSGGLSLKRHEHIMWMKSDMAGAAAALAAVRAVAQLGLRVNVVAAVALAENMPGSNATRPGDVVVHRGGRTSEVADTDAEGRVLLADVLAYLSEQAPAVILDSATLTDAAGLGVDLWAVMSTDRALAAELLEAGAEAGEPGWELPLWSPYRRLIDSDIADVRNLGEHGTDSTIMAGLFLRDFVGSAPWLHVDTGSSAWAEHPGDLWPVGATGSPTRAFVRFIERRAAARR